MKWGLIGASTIASEWMIGAIRSLPGHEISSVMSNDPSRAKSFAAMHGIKQGTSDLDKLLADREIGAVYISSTNEKHHPQAMAAVAAGKHIICEKPLAVAMRDALEMVGAARDKGLVFGTNHHLRNAGSHLTIKDLVAAGKIGKLLSMKISHSSLLPENLHGWRINKVSAGGGVILDKAVHDVDMLRFYLGEDPVSVMTVAASTGMGEGVEDSAMSVLKMPSGVMVHTHQSFVQPHCGNGFEVHGTEGSIIGRNIMQQKAGGEIIFVDRLGTSNVPFSGHNLYERSLGLFNDAVAGRGRPAADGIDGIKSLAIALAMLESAKNDTSAKIDYCGI